MASDLQPLSADELARLRADHDDRNPKADHGWEVGPICRLLATIDALVAERTDSPPTDDSHAAWFEWLTVPGRTFSKDGVVYAVTVVTWCSDCDHPWSKHGPEGCMHSIPGYACPCTEPRPADPEAQAAPRTDSPAPGTDRARQMIEDVTAEPAATCNLCDAPSVLTVKRHGITAQRCERHSTGLRGAAEENRDGSYTIADPEPVEPQWQVTVTVPARLTRGVRNLLFEVLAEAAHEWEETITDEDKDWDVDVSARTVDGSDTDTLRQARQLAARVSAGYVISGVGPAHPLIALLDLLTEGTP